jgi:DNA replication protein DnaC
MIIANHEAVFKALIKLRRQVVDGCAECGGKELGCRCRFKMMLYEQAAKSNVPLGLLTKKYTDFGVGQENNEVVADLKKKWYWIIYSIKDIITAGKLVVISGPNGTGKTMMASIAVKSAIASGHTAQYILFSQLVDAFLNKNDEDLLDICAAVDILVIDEVGKEYKKLNQFGEYDTNSNMASYCRYVLEHIVKLRADAGLATFIVSNDSLDEIDAKYGGVDSALSSVLHSNNTETIYHSGMDFRRLDV